MGAGMGRLRSFLLVRGRFIAPSLDGLCRSRPMAAGIFVGRVWTSTSAPRLPARASRLLSGADTSDVCCFIWRTIWSTTVSHSSALREIGLPFRDCPPGSADVSHGCIHAGPTSCMAFYGRSWRRQRGHVPVRLQPEVRQAGSMETECAAVSRRSTQSILQTYGKTHVVSLRRRRRAPAGGAASVSRCRASRRSCRRRPGPSVATAHQSSWSSNSE
jgi:hypothetical protein